MKSAVSRFKDLKPDKQRTVKIRKTDGAINLKKLVFKIWCLVSSASLRNLVLYNFPKKAESNVLKKITTKRLNH